MIAYFFLYGAMLLDFTEDAQNNLVASWMFSCKKIKYIIKCWLDHYNISFDGYR
jgi:hypothetical protein